MLLAYFLDLVILLFILEIRGDERDFFLCLIVLVDLNWLCERIVFVDVHFTVVGVNLILLTC